MHTDEVRQVIAVKRQESQIVVEVFGKKRYVKLLVEHGIAGFDFGRVIQFKGGILSPGAYINNRKIATLMRVRLPVWRQAENTVKKFQNDISFIAGVATGGITHGMVLAERYGLPYVSVRLSEKGYGAGGNIDGDVSVIKGRSGLLVEDMSTTFESALQAIDTLKDTDVHVSQVLALNAWNLPQFKTNTAGHMVYVGCTGEQMVDEALRQGKIDKDYHQLLMSWIENPDDESWIKPEIWRMPKQ